MSKPNHGGDLTDAEGVMIGAVLRLSWDGIARPAQENQYDLKGMFNILHIGRHA